MTQAQRLERMRELAEQALLPMKLKELAGHLLLLGRVDDAAPPHVARAVIVQDRPRDMGLVIVRFSRAQDALAMSLNGWILIRVAPGGRVVGPLPDDYQVARRCIEERGMPTVMPLGTS